MAEINLTDISAEEFNRRNIIPTPFYILDVREVIEFQTFNLGGRNIPLGSLLKNIEAMASLEEKELVVICQQGLRSETARRILVKQGFKNVRNLAGGILALRKLNY